MWKNVLLLLITLVVIPSAAFLSDDTLTALQQAVLIRLIAVYLGTALLCFIVSSLAKNYSQVDKLWSVMPLIYSWIIAFKSGFEPRLLLMASLVTVWGIRLSWNFWRRGGYSWKFWSGKEDYRWAILQSRPEFQASWKWTLFNLLFISLYQMGLILLMTLPALRSLEGEVLTWGDGLVAGLMVLFILIETIADQQQWNFHKRKKMLAEKSEDLPDHYKKGFVHTGLWSLVRHPNYAAEQSVWIAFYFFSALASGQWMNWSVMGAILLVLLFWGSSNFSESVTLGKYPDYAAYRKRVPRFVPFFRNAALLAVATAFSMHPAISQENSWTHFRGNGLNGISGAGEAPVHWNDSTNILWKTDIAGKGWSSPVVFGNQVWVTAASEKEREMSGICLDLNSGEIMSNIKLFQPDTLYPKHDVNSYATPTPCIEEGYVYFHFGTYGTACVNTADGTTVWKRTDLNCNHAQGPGSSPFLYQNLLILHIEGTDVQYIVALDKHTGETVWKTGRPAKLYEPLEPIGKKAYITPIIVKVNGRDLLISNGSAVCMAYDPETGEEVWRIVEGEDSTIAMPFAENGILYFYPGFVTGTDGEKYSELLAVNPDGTGDISGTHVLWRFRSPVLQLLSPLIKNGLIYTVDTRNVLYCLDAKTGNEVYSRKLKQKYPSSPVYAGGNIYFTSVRGETMVIRAGNRLQVIAENKLPGEVYATPAIVGNSILLRTDKSLYRIGLPR